MSPSVLTSFPSDQTLFEQFSRDDDRGACSGAFKRVKLYHNPSSPSDADSVGTAAGASSCSSGDDPEALSRQNLPVDEDRTVRSDDDVGLVTAHQAPHEESDVSSSGTPELLDDGYQYLPGSTKLRRLLERSDRLIVCPGVFDGFSARVAMSVGFEGLYMTGAGTTASRLGMPDLAMAQLHDMREQAEMICNLTPYGPPVIADMDAGYGGPIMVAKAVQQYARAGVAGFHIEDQILSKRCGHLKGKEVVDMNTFLMRIRAAKKAKDQIRSDIVLIARTDALQTRGYDECIARLKAARDLGADVGILEGFTSKEQARQAVKDLAPWPLLLNMIENGASPLISTQEAQEMGFRIMIFSLAALSSAYVAMKATFEKLKYEGVTGVPQHVTPKKLFEVVGLDEMREIDEGAGGAAFSKV
ncbi:Pyruvate/Phosphoenolpyruvate kinase-like domain-containing protein [Macrophomina phaseolina]|uniref:Pyruvate/Phosphoenolpyruvate kinase-like domain-containing protein n=1 Tax=Macrophomina phaseolina TaxID=35725 RepID=A0ABQ8FPX7_9PEZI|nr:Pyruvate/Phosphoenolpyruvate kinase-like domain-containing protein [Macrophomina phaseolina]